MLTDAGVLVPWVPFQVIGVMVPDMEAKIGCAFGCSSSISAFALSYISAKLDR